MPELLDRPVTKTRTSPTELTAEQKAQFERDGYLVLRSLFSPAEAAAIRDAFMAANADGPVPGLSSIGEGIMDPSDPLAFYPRMMNPHLQPSLAVGTIARDFL